MLSRQLNQFINREEAVFLKRSPQQLMPRKTDCDSQKCILDPCCLPYQQEHLGGHVCHQQSVQKTTLVLTPTDTHQTHAQTDTPDRMPTAHWASDTLTPVPTSEVETHTPHRVGGPLEPGKNASLPGLPFPLTSPRAADLLQQGGGERGLRSP